MRSGPVTALVLLLGGCGSSERCLEVLTDGVAPSATTWVVEAGYLADDSTLRSVGGGRGILPSGTHAATCTSPGQDETWRLLVWFDDGASSPFDTYCNLLERGSADCSPRPGQPSGEKTFGYAGAGLTTVTVTIHPP